MLSWWVGLSREDFWQECRTHQFSTRWNTTYASADSDCPHDSKFRDRNLRGREALKQYRDAGFYISTSFANLTESIKVTDQFEVIPYHERQAALENR